jgi:class 3 adenylate cyclase
LQKRGVWISLTEAPRHRGTEAPRHRGTEHRGTGTATIPQCRVRSDLTHSSADNLYVFFHRVEPAVNAAVASHRELARKEKRRSDPLRVSIGIGFGPLYYVSSEDDYYGAEVNLASKLGEDIAFGGETLLTEAALAAIEEPVEGRAGRLRYATVSQVRIRFRPWLV